VKTVQFILGADMRGNHDSLKQQAKSCRVSLGSLAPGEAVVFINKARDKMKAYSYNNVISYYRSPDPSRPIDLDSLDEIPRAFNKRGELDYTKALKLRLEKKLAKKKFKGMEKV
jgi:hypothetical protein